jgi:hypothetical protein
MRLRDYWRGFVEGLQVLWWPVAAMGRAAYVSRASIVALLFGGGLIAFTDQARDMVLASIAPDASVGSKLAVAGAVFFWAFSSWIWSRAALDAGFKMRRDLPGLARWQKGWITILCNHVPRVIGAASIAAVALAFQSGYATYRDAGATADAERYWDYAIAVSVLAVIFYLLLAIRKHFAVRLDQRMEGEKQQAALRAREANDDKTKEAKTWRRVHSALSGLERVILGASLLAFSVGSYWFGTNPVATAAFFGNSINVVLVGLALLTPVLGALVLLSEWSKLPIFGTVVILTALMPELTHDHHDVRLCEPGGDKTRCADPGYPTAIRNDLKAAFLGWWDYNVRSDMFAPLAADLPEDLRTPPFVLVATAGGASRAAFWTSLVLGELAAREYRFADRTFLVSGVSGGSLGATFFRSIVEEDRRRSFGEGSPWLRSAPLEAERFMQHDFLSPTLGAGLFVDLPLGPVSFLTGRGSPGDRAAALEKSWEAAWIESAAPSTPRQFSWDSGFLKVFGKGAGGHRVWPILALNGTSVVKGKRIITSNADFQVSESAAPSKPDLDATMSQSENRYETFRLLNADIPISTAVTMSARFPGISPTGGLKDRQGTLRGRITDGGLFENFGAMTADEVLRHLGARIKEAQWWRDFPERKPIMPLVIVISSDPSLDPILGAELPKRPNMNPDCDAVDHKSELIVAAGNRHAECPTPALHHSSILTDPLRALYSGRVERGQSAVAALFDRSKDLIRYAYEGLNNKVDAKRVHDHKPKDGFELIKGQFGSVNDVPFFHFRQCRLKKRKGPTMSWHDSSEAWDAMQIMTGLHGANDPVSGRSPDPAASADDECDNAAEFYRLCVRLTMMAGVLDLQTGVRARPADPQEAFTLAQDDCAKRWPAPTSR